MDDAVCIESWTGKNAGRRSFGFLSEKIYRGMLISKDFCSPCIAGGLLVDTNRKINHRGLTPMIDFDYSTDNVKTVILSSIAFVYSIFTVSEFFTVSISSVEKV